MSAKITKHFLSKFSGENPHLAAQEFGKLTAALPDWAQATLLHDDISYNDIARNKVVEGVFLPKKITKTLLWLPLLAVFRCLSSQEKLA